MKCSRAKLCERRSSTCSSKSEFYGGSVTKGRYCQRRLADSDLDYKHWLHRYPTGRYHLEESESGADMSGRSEVPAILAGLATPAFLTVTELSIPVNSQPRKYSFTSKYKLKTVPRTCSAHLHRMFIRVTDSEDSSITEDDSSIITTTDYTEYNNFEEYLRDLEIPACITPEGSIETHAPQPPPSPSPTIITPPKLDKPLPVNTKHQKRKSITISRLPSPETVQIIRVDVITGYPVESDASASILSESENSNLVEKNSDCVIDLNQNRRQEDFANFIENCSLLSCRSLSLVERN